MITETILKKFKNNLFCEEIHLPHGTKSAKLVCHVDLDGVCSGISMVQQLAKQGIPKERITIEFAQYGDEKKDKNFKGRFEGKKGQYIGVTDFAKLPKCKPFEIFNKLMGFKGNKKDLVDFMKSKDFSSVSLNSFEKELRSKFNIVDNKFTKGSIKDLHDAFVAYYCLDNKPLLSTSNIEDLSYKLVNPDFVSDHHSNEDGALSGGKKGEIGAKSPSENEIMATKYAPGIWSKDDVAAISAVDSANYTEDELKNTIFLEKNFKGPNKKKNLAIIISTVYDNMVKKDSRAAKYVILNAGPSLISLYTTTLKAAGLSAKSVEAFNLLKDGKTKEALEIMKTMPKIFTKNWTDKDTYEKKVRPVLKHEDWAAKNKKDLEKAKTGYQSEADKQKLEEIKGKKGAEYKAIRDDINSKKGKLASSHNFTLFNGTDARTQYSRYMSTLYSVKGQRNPFSIRYWRDEKFGNCFFQVSKSPLYKGDVDFQKVQEKVFEDIKSFLQSKNFSSFKIDLILKTMKQENGGHKNAIWSFQGFDKIKESSSEIGGDEYWKRRDIVKKATELNMDLNRIKKSNDFVNSKKPIIDGYKETRWKCMQHAIKSVIKWTNELYPVSKEDLDKLKNTDERFEGR